MGSYAIVPCKSNLLGIPGQVTYKGEANLYSIQIGEKLHEGLAWIYPYPTLECTKIQGFVGFFNEKLDIYEGDKLLPRPKTIWS